MEAGPTPAQPAVPPPKKSKTLLWVVVGCGAFLFIGMLVFGGFAWWGYHKAKSYLNTDSTSSKDMPQLWSDVPRMDGMIESQHVDMPIGIKAVARAMMDKMMQGLNDGKDAGHWDWTGYTVNGKTAADVQQFYTSERMATNGWKTEGGCAGMSTGLGTEQPTFCSFQKEEGKKSAGLLIVAATDQEKNAVSVFFVRQESQRPNQ